MSVSHLGQAPFAAALGVAGAGTGNGTLGDAYLAGNVAGDSTITLDSTRGGITIAGASLSSSAAILTVTGAAAATLFTVSRATATGVQATAPDGNGRVTVNDTWGVRLAYGAGSNFTVDGNGFQGTGSVSSLVWQLSIAGAGSRYQFSVGSVTATSSTSRGMEVTATFAPTSGTGAYRGSEISYTINQTGGANGAVDGLLIDSTQTALGGTHNIIRARADGQNVLAVQPGNGTTDLLVTWRSEAQRSSYFATHTYSLAGVTKATWNVSSAGKIYVNAPIAGGQHLIDINGCLFDVQDATAGTVPNLAMGAGSFGSGKGVFFIGNANTIPSANPTGGGILYVTAGALKYRGSGGTVTNIAAA